jgi:aspartyl-tRNA(Asn)/glutamyl-tRNA(Gln) amidotransferase subunit A
VAAGQAPVALGSDTGGSVRQPAAFCGVFGLKPTYGRLSRFGLVAFASSLEQIGILALHLEDLAAVYAAAAGPDERDATTGAGTPEPFLPETRRRLRVGWAASLLDHAGLDAETAGRVREIADLFREAGHAVVPVALPDPDAAVAAYYVLATAEASSNLARYDGVRYGRRHPAEHLDAMYRLTREHGFGTEVKRRILLGTFALSAGYADAFYHRAQSARTGIRRAFDALFEALDVVLLPVTPTPAFALGEKVDDPVAMYLADLFTVYANLAGCPALAVPAGRTVSGLPVGVQLMAARGREPALGEAARVIVESGRYPASRAPSGGGS